MRGFLATISLALVFVGAYAVALETSVFGRTCNVPLTYQIGSVDEEFMISTSTIRSVLTDAESVWESGTSRDLFSYSTSSADLTVNFTFDRRQQRTQEQNELDSNLSALEQSHEGLTSDLKNRRDQYNDLLSEYESARQQYEQALQEFNDRVNYWNQQSGVPESTQQELRAQRDQLDQARESLSTTRDQLLRLQDQINRLTERSNRIAQTYNEKAETFASRFGSSREFSQATYEDSTITIFQFEETADLRLAMAHEFGHALGLGHVENPEAVMYHLMEEQSLNPISLTPSDRQAVNSICD